MRILLAEDDPLLGDGLRAGLRQRGFQVDWVRDGAAAEREMRAEPYAAAVLDLGLPRIDGIDVLRAVRAAGRTLPVLVLTARDAVDDRVRGLDGGADDYVIKPIDLDELAARLRALVRRAHGQAQGALRVQDLVLDVATRRVSCDGQDIALPLREFDLLANLARVPDRPLSRAALLKAVWRIDFDPGTNRVEVHMSRLRAKVDRGFDWPMLQTVKGLGYALKSRPDGAI